MRKRIKLRKGDKKSWGKDCKLGGVEKSWQKVEENISSFFLVQTIEHKNVSGRILLMTNDKMPEWRSFLPDGGDVVAHFLLATEVRPVSGLIYTFYYNLCDKNHQNYIIWLKFRPVSDFNERYFS